MKILALVLVLVLAVGPIIGECSTMEEFKAFVENSKDEKDFLKIFPEEEKFWIQAFEQSLDHEILEMYAKKTGYQSGFELVDIGSLFYKYKRTHNRISLDGFLEWIYNQLLKHGTATVVREKFDELSKKVQDDYLFVSKQQQFDNRPKDLFDLLESLVKEYRNSPEYKMINRRLINKIKQIK